MHRYFTAKVDIRLSKEILYYSLPMIPNSLGWWINHSVSRLFLNHYCGVADVGLYSASTKMPNIIDTFRGFFVQAWQLSTIMEYNNKEAISFFHHIYRLYNIFLILLCSLLMMLSQLIASILYSKDFFEAWRYTPLLIAGVLFGSMIAYFTPSYLAHKKTKRLFLSTLFGAVVTLILNAILTPRIGILGAAITTMMSNLAVFLFVFIDCRKYFNFELINYRFIISYIIIVIHALVITFLGVSPISVWSFASLLAVVMINKNDISLLVKESLTIVIKKFHH